MKWPLKFTGGLTYVLLLASVSMWSAAVANENNGARHARPQVEKQQMETNAKRSMGYLLKAREYRDQGRYELARQSCLQALAICVDADMVKVIQRELNGIEILLRTMR